MKRKFVNSLVTVSLVSCIAITSWHVSSIVGDFPDISQKVVQICEKIDIDWTFFDDSPSSEEIPENEPVTIYGDEYTIANNIDTVLLLQEQEWKRLSIDKKKDVLNTVLSIECRYLDLNRKVNLIFKDLEEDVEGTYSHSSSTICISLWLLEEGSAHDNLDTLCHEVYHSAEHQMVDNYLSLSEIERNSSDINSELAETYLYEFDNYIDGEEDFDAYYQQQCEVRARAYAEVSVNDYYRRINEYQNP